MAFLNKLAPMALALLLCGCYEDFTPKVDTRPVLCLNSLITAGEPVEVEVTHTWLFTDEAGSADHSVDDARVTVFANGEAAGPDYIAREGDHIKIVAESQRYGRAEAEVTVPYSVIPSVGKWSATNVSVWSGPTKDWTEYDISFSLNVELEVPDPVATVNYYHLDRRTFPENEPDIYGYKMSIYGGSLATEFEPIFSEHISELDAVSGNDSFGFTFFTDRQFTGKTYTLHLHNEGMRYYIECEGFDSALLDCGLVFTLSSVSESYYNWAVCKWNTDNGLMGDLGDIGLGDPMWGYSNVSTGAGVVAARSRSECALNIAPFLKDHVATP